MWVQQSILLSLQKKIIFFFLFISSIKLFAVDRKKRQMKILFHHYYYCDYDYYFLFIFRIFTIYLLNYCWFRLSSIIWKIEEEEKNASNKHATFFFFSYWKAINLSRALLILAMKTIITNCLYCYYYLMINL